MSDKERLENLSPIVVAYDGNVLLSSDDYHWLLNQAEKTQKYREALEEITKVDLSEGKSREYYQTEAVYMKITALKALEESK